MLRAFVRIYRVFSVEEIEILYERQKPDGRKVTDTISTEAVILAQQKGLGYLKRAARSFSGELLLRFLRFVSGSDSVILPATGLSRRVVANTYSQRTDLPMYYNYDEFLIE